MLTEIQPGIEIEKQILEKQKKRKTIKKLSVIFTLVGLLSLGGTLFILQKYSPASIESLLVERHLPTSNASVRKESIFTHDNFQFSYPGLYEIEYQTSESVTFSGAQSDGQQFPSVLVVSYSHTIDHERVKPCDIVAFRPGITSQCKEGLIEEKEINGRPYREFYLIGGKGEEGKLRQVVIQFLNPPQIQVTHIILPGVENKLNEILPTFQFEN